MDFQKPSPGGGGVDTAATTRRTLHASKNLKNMTRVKHKCFISYHKRDKDAVDEFCEKFSGSFIRRGIMMEEDIINSNNTEYVMKRIRELYLKDSTVTIVLIGKCTWARRFVDWEVQASLRNPSDSYPNGLVAIQLWDSYKNPSEQS